MQLCTLLVSDIIPPNILGIPNVISIEPNNADNGIQSGKLILI